LQLSLFPEPTFASRRIDTTEDERREVLDTVGFDSAPAPIDAAAAGPIGSQRALDLA